MPVAATELEMYAAPKYTILAPAILQKMRQCRWPAAVGPKASS